jgi:hypothetical protein
VGKRRNIVAKNKKAKAKNKNKNSSSVNNSLKDQKDKAEDDGNSG